MQSGRNLPVLRSSGSLDTSAPLVSKRLHADNVKSFLLDAPYDPFVHQGMKNPYTGDVIATKEDYIRYVHEYVYCRECEDEINKRYAKELSCKESALIKYQKENNQISSTIQFLREQNSKYSKQIADYEESKRRAFRFALLRGTCLLFLICYLLFAAIPNAKQKGYKAGEESGLASGYASGVEQGYSAGYSEGSTAGYKSGEEAGKRSATSKYSSVSGDLPASTEVYVSKSGGKIHVKSNCSGMAHYYTMTYGEAVTRGYAHCSKCF